MFLKKAAHVFLMDSVLQDQDENGRWRGKHAKNTLSICYLALAKGYR